MWIHLFLYLIFYCFDLAIFVFEGWLLLRQSLLSFLLFNLILLKELTKINQLYLYLEISFSYLLLHFLKLLFISKWNWYYFLYYYFWTSNASWTSYILLLFSRSLVAGDTVSNWIWLCILFLFFCGCINKYYKNIFVYHIEEMCILL